jgi:hypothetical protein
MVPIRLLPTVVTLPLLSSQHLFRTGTTSLTLTIRFQIPIFLEKLLSVHEDLAVPIWQPLLQLKPWRHQTLKSWNNSNNSQTNTNQTYRYVVDLLLPSQHLNAVLSASNRAL